MGRELSIGDVLHPRASPRTMFLRGLCKRCPRCGGGHLFRGWFRMRDRCPSCGYLFEREEGFFFGAYLVNLVVTEAFLFAVFLGYIAVHGAQGDALKVALIAACIFAVVVPVLFYPFSRTLWAAVDLIFTPLELKEIVEAADAAGAGEPGDDDDRPVLGPPAPDPADPPTDPPAVAWDAGGPHRPHRRHRRHPRWGRPGHGPAPGRG